MKQQNFLLLIKFSELSSVLRKICIVLLFLCAFVFLLMSKFSAPTVQKISEGVFEISTPIIHVLEFPARIIHRAYTYIYDVSHIFSDNQMLREENRQMMFLQNRVRALEVENQLLGRLLNYVPPSKANYISAKVMATSGDVYAHTLVVYIGNSPVKKGQIVLGNESVIGRVEKVGGKYAQVILVTDINSKIPVVIERTRARGILSGNNTDIPQIVFTRPKADIQAGDLVVTSGVGGMFPSGLPVGFVSSVKNGKIDVETIADIDRVEYLKIVDYGDYSNPDLLMKDEGDE